MAVQKRIERRVLKSTASCVCTTQSMPADKTTAAQGVSGKCDGGYSDLVPEIMTARWPAWEYLAMLFWSDCGGWIGVSVVVV